MDEELIKAIDERIIKHYNRIEECKRVKKAAEYAIAIDDSVECMKYFSIVFISLLFGIWIGKVFF